MNQTNAKELILSKVEAQNLQADIFDLLTQIQALSDLRQEQTAEAAVSIEMDGGGF